MTRVRRALAATTRTAQALVQATSEKELVERVCAIVVDAGYRFCWAGLAEHDADKTVRPLAWAGHEDGYLSHAKITWSDTARGRGPAGTSIRTAKPAVFHDVVKNQNFHPWRTEARRRGYRSICGLPLVVRGVALGTLCIYAGQPAAFGMQEIELLANLAEMLSFGIMSFRDAQRSREALREASELKTQVIENAPGGVIVYNQDLRCELWNRYMENLTGVPASEIMGKNSLDVFPVLRVLGVEEGLRRALAGEVNMGNDIPFKPPHTGKTLWLSGRYAPVRDAAGCVTKVVVTVRDVTEVKKSEEALRESEHRLQEATHVSRIGIFDHDHVTDAIYHSSVLRDLYDLRPDEPMTLPVIFARTHPEDRERMREGVQRTLDPRGDPSVNSEYRIVRRDGSIRWMATRAQTIFQGEGSARHATHTIGAIFDVTERREAEEKIAASERQLRQILDALFGFVGLYTVEGVLIEANRAPLEAAGLTREDVIGKPFWETYWWSYHPTVQAELRDALARAAKGEVVRYEPRVRVKDGKLIDIDVTFSPLRGADQNITGIVGFAVDITERRRAETELRETEERLHQLADNIPEVFWMVDTSTGNSTYVSPAYESIWGRSSADLRQVSQEWLDAIHPEDRGRVQQAYARGLAGGMFEQEYRIVRPDGEIRWVHDRGFPIQDRQGKVYREGGVATDITERKLAELRLAESLREKETLLREIHHRVKNNLQIISSLLHFQSKKVADGEAKAVFLEGQDRLRSMILVHDRLYRSQNLSAVDFGDYVDSLAHQLVRSSETASRNIRLTIEAANVSLPVEMALPCGMILSELLTNVFKYAFPDGRPGEALLRVTANGDRLLMMVQDTGVGFGDAGSAASTGFGLQLVYTLTEQLNGLIRIESSNGTCVTVEVPLGRLVHAN